MTIYRSEMIDPNGTVVATELADSEANTITYDPPRDGVDERPMTPEEIAYYDQRDLVAAEAANTTTMVAESDESVDKLVAVVEALNAITDMTNAAINQNAAAVIKDLARECKTIARQANREARLTSGRTESTDTGPVTDV
jgi:hypothetical protein